MPPVPAPYQERVVEDTAVHAYGSVYVVPGEGGGAYDHAVGDVVVPAFLRHLRRQPQIVPVERRHVLRPGDIAGADLTPLNRTSLVTSTVFISVTIGIGASIHSRNASALVVSSGLISLILQQAELNFEAAKV